MQVDTARSVLTSPGRPAGRPAEPWAPPPMSATEIQRSQAAVSPFDRIAAAVLRWLS